MAINSPYKLAIIQKTDDGNNFIVLYYATFDEWATDYWKEWCEGIGCTIQIAKEEVTYIPDCEYPLILCTLKTFWLNIFKRIWRKKHALIVKRKKIKNLIARSIHGRWVY